MTNKPENPPAFPRDDTTWGMYGERGMTLRDYFAGQALAGLSSVTSNRAIAPDAIARIAYADADAMLKERSK